MSIRDEEIADFKIGDIVYECEGGVNIETRVTSKPVFEENEVAGKIRKQWSWSAVNTQNGKKIDYMLTEGLSHYGPRLYRQPEYVQFGKDGSWSVRLLGQK